MELGVMVGALVDGLGLSAWIFVVTLVGSLPLGIVVALCRMSSFKPLSLLAQFYISILRGTPLMLQLMAFMFGPYYLLGMNMGTDWKFGACAVGFILNYSAYFAEIYRSGIQSIPKGQYEAALVLGYSRSQTFFKIVLPQAIRYVIPSLISQLVVVVKDTTVAYVVSYPDMLQNARVLITNYDALVSTYLVVAVIYILLNYAINQLSVYVARRSGIRVVSRYSTNPA